MAQQLPSPLPVPDHDQAMAGAGRVIDLQTPNTTYGPEIQRGPDPDAGWHQPGTSYPGGTR